MFKVLFVCIHNSARSQIAEAFLKLYGGELFYADSAGIEPGTLNPYVVRVLKEIDIDISNHKTSSVFDYYKQGKTFNAVIKVCDQKNGERCPIFPGVLYQLNWDFNDPSKFVGTDEEIMEQVRALRESIRLKILEFIDFYKDIAVKRKDLI